jgi:hypothetical protein
MNTVPKLAPGNYMKSNALLHALYQIYRKPDLAETVEKNCPIHIGEFGQYFSTVDLKSIMDPAFFKNLECEIVTHMILSEEEKMKTWI